MSANGHLTQAELRPIMGGFYLAPAPAAAWNAMGAEILREEGITIRVNGPDSAYRSFSRQQYWRNWWCNQGACQNAATPGTSNHGLGWAVDVPEYVSALMVRYGAKYGWRRECSDAPWEGWHWKWCGGWNGKDPGPSGQGVKYPTLKKGDEGAAVRRMQKHLRRWNVGLTRPTADGSFGDGTKKALREFQITHHLTPDGVCGAKTWHRLRKRDHFLTDERRRLNAIAMLRYNDLRDNPAWQRQLRGHKLWCGYRGRRILKAAEPGGWDRLYRRERFNTLKAIAGGTWEETRPNNGGISP